jgi:hypothetical protein
MFILLVIGLLLVTCRVESENVVDGLRCKWRQFLVLDPQSSCPTGYSVCPPSVDLASACKAFNPRMKICCQQISTTTDSTTTSTTTASSTITSSFVFTATLDSSSDSDSDESFDIGNLLQAGMCGIYPPSEANRPPCMINQAYNYDPDGDAADRKAYFVVPVAARFESAACLCEAWGGRLAVGPLGPSILKLLGACTNGMAWVDVKGDACVAAYSRPVPKVDWVACESYLPVLCEF